MDRDRDNLVAGSWWAGIEIEDRGPPGDGRLWAPFKKKGRHYDKTVTTALAGDGKAAPPLVAALPPFSLFRGALWVLSIVPHDYTGKHREAYSPPLNSNAT